MTKLAMVTGASSGIGEAYANRLAADGWDLVVVARRKDRLVELAARLEDEYETGVQVLEADLTDRTDLGHLSQHIRNASPDLLVNNAGLAHYMAFAELPPERAEELVEVNVLAPLRLTRAALPAMLERGHGAIINIASALAFSGPVTAPQLPQRAVYAATKSFLVTFSECLAAEVDPSGVRIQVVCPALVRSEFHTRQGIDMSARPRMEPDEVVTASLIDLANAVVVSIPPLATIEPADNLKAASQQLVAACTGNTLPDRYSKITPGAQ